MLATIPPSAHETYLHSPTAGSAADAGSPGENKVCPGCQLTVMNENGGVVIAFGQSFFHIDCFKCAKCHDRVTADTNLLLLSDGQPVCSNCSYSCSVCRQPILDEAIMTGDDSYHAHCFKCRSCHNRIDELMFAKTSHGIYCMKCHHQRVARSRRHAQKKERDKAAPGSAAGSAKPSRDRAGREQLGENGNSSATPFTPDFSSLPSASTPGASAARMQPSPTQVNGDSDALHRQGSQGGRSAAHSGPDGPQSTPHTPTAPALSSRRTSRNAVLSSSASPSLSPTRADPPSLEYSAGPSSPTIVVPLEGSEAGPQVSLSYLQPEASTESGGAKPFLSPDPSTGLERRRSWDDGTRPLDVLFRKSDDTPTGLGLGIPSKRAGKRNSINPGMSFNYDAVASEINRAAAASSAPQSPSSAAPPTPDKDRGSGTVDFQPSHPREPASEDLSRPPSRRAPLDPPASASASASASAVAGAMLSRSRSRAESSPRPLTSADPIRPPLRPHITLDRLPPRSQSLRATTQEPDPVPQRLSPLPTAKASALSRTASDDTNKARPGAPLSIDVERSRAGYGATARPTSPAYKASSPSPAHKVDVPHGIESGTDTSDGEHERSADEGGRPPALPPKEGAGAKTRRRPVQLDLDTRAPAAQDDGTGSHSAGDADSEDESSPVERVSHSTFIAPAHPPIRMSVSANGFQELLALVDPRNRSSVASFEELVKLNHDAAALLDAGGSGSGSAAGALERSESERWRRPATPTSATTLTTSQSWSSVADSSSVTTVSAPSSQGHGDSGAAAPARSSPELVHGEPAAQIMVTAPEASGARPARLDPPYPIAKRLQEALHEAARRGTTQVVLDQEFVHAVLMTIEQRRDEHAQMKGRLDHIKRASQQAMDGLSVAQGEYDAELKARRDAEAEVTRLRILLAGQAARITALSGEGRRDALHKQLTRELSDNLSVLEQDVSKLRVERDVALVEMEEIASSVSSSDVPDREGAGISRSVTRRLDNLKTQYRGALVALTDERAALQREIAELQSARDVFLEETTMLNARNEELAQLNALYMRRIEAAAAAVELAPMPMPVAPAPPRAERPSLERPRPAAPPAMQPSASLGGTASDESADMPRPAKPQRPPPQQQQQQQQQQQADGTLRIFKPRRGNTSNNNTTTSKEAAAIAAALAAQEGAPGAGEKSWVRHAFQQVSVLRPTRCDHCGEKLWGSAVRCTACSISVHPRCQHHVQTSCSQQNSRRDEATPAGPLQPCTFGGDLTEQVRADSKLTDKMVPMIVEKCIAAVEDSALDYEGIYRKTGGSGQSKTITQLFERGDYGAFDLLDTERFNDICSVTSVLKSYFRSLPNPLLTFVLHDEFIFASTLRDPAHKSAKYADLIKQLPTEHYYTLRMLMLHLHRIQEHHHQNLMTARNLGVVFGPTLMRSRNPGAEFSDMAGKALTIEWLVENAPSLFPPLPTH
ncbi:hypothetical protein BC834DRAFT_842865 [Gloeopeniophorella convolvens]|nr:hypothetical protein BC834DRAFT_842865 [Gloeopeniophorella convolvens]